MDEKLRAAVEEIMRKYSGSSIDVLNQQLGIIQDEYNNTGQDGFEGLSPEQMRGLLYGKWGDNLITINPEKFDGNDIPIIKQLKYFINIVNENKEIKLTKTGSLPPAIVKDIYSQKFLTELDIELGVSKLTKETDVANIVIMKILCKIGRLVKIRSNKMSLTKQAPKIINSNDLFGYLFDITCNRYNWAYFDSFVNPLIGQFGYNYSLYLIHKYGNNWNYEDYYANLYFKAFGHLQEDDDEERYSTLWITYGRRTFTVLRYYGLIEFENKRLESGSLRKTKIFDKYIRVNA
jgi:hypothetical protein